MTALGSFAVGFGRRQPPDPVAAPAIVAAAEPERTDADVAADVARVAEQHAPDGGYGETAWNPFTATVFWVCGDWTSDEELEAAEAAFRAVEGVENFEHEAEAALPEGDGWEAVWPEGVTASGARSARRPVDSLTQAAFRAVERVHERTVASIADHFRLARGDGGRAHDAALTAAVDALAEVAKRPAPAPPSVDVTVQPADITVNTPEMRPEFRVELDLPAPEVALDVDLRQPDVHVTVEPPPPAPAPQVDVHVDVPPAPAPEVHVTVEQPRPRAVRVETAADGSRIFVPEPAE